MVVNHQLFLLVAIILLFFLLNFLSLSIFHDNYKLFNLLRKERWKVFLERYDHLLATAISFFLKGSQLLKFNLWVILLLVSFFFILFPLFLIFLVLDSIVQAFFFLLFFYFFMSFPLKYVYILFFVLVLFFWKEYKKISKNEEFKKEFAFTFLESLQGDDVFIEKYQWYFSHLTELIGLLW